MLLGETYYLFAFNLLIGLILGSVLYRSDYCMAGMFRDVFLFRNYSLLRSLLLLVVIAMVLFYAARVAGLISVYPSPTYGYASSATLIGGVIFGLGMVLAGGCVVGTLYKMGGGNLTYLITFGGLITGSLLYAEIHPFWETVRENTAIVKHVLISQITPAGEVAALLITVAASSALFLKWKREGKWTLTAYAAGYLQPWKAAVVIALLNVLVAIFSGWPMGVTTAYAKIGAYVESFVAPSHLENLSYFSRTSVSAFVSGVSVSGGAAPEMDIISLTEMPLVIGIVAGSFLTALFLREFKIYGLPPGRQIVTAFAGGVLMALGARIASGCNIKFVAGALPLLSLQGLVFVPAMIAGAYFGTLLLKKVHNKLLGG